jgi:hypothetical protein
MKTRYYATIGLVIGSPRPYSSDERAWEALRQRTKGQKVAMVLYKEVPVQINNPEVYWKFAVGDKEASKKGFPVVIARFVPVAVGVSTHKWNLGKR